MAFARVEDSCRPFRGGGSKIEPVVGAAGIELDMYEAQLANQPFALGSAPRYL